MHTLVTESDSHKMISKFEEEKIRLEISDWSSKSVTEEFLSSLSQVDIYGFKKKLHLKSSNLMCPLLSTY